MLHQSESLIHSCSILKPEIDLGVTESQCTMLQLILTSHGGLHVEAFVIDKGVLQFILRVGRLDEPMTLPVQQALLARMSLWLSKLGLASTSPGESMLTIHRRSPFTFVGPDTC